MNPQSPDQAQQAPSLPEHPGETRREEPAPSGPIRKRGRTPRSRKKRPRAQSERPAGSTLDPALIINRELSWLEFNQRVLEEARDPRHPLLERVKFLAIVSSNLDEFFMIRVAAIKEQILADVHEQSPDGLDPLDQIRAIHRRVDTMLHEMTATFWNDLHPRLSDAGIHLVAVRQLEQADRGRLADHFAREIFPVLTPLAFDPGHPFPYISNLSLNLAVVVCTTAGEERFARVKVPDVLPRLVEVPGSDGDRHHARFVWLEDLIADNLAMLFPGMAVKESYVFRVTRNADIEIQEDEAEDLIRSIEESIRLRRFGSVVRVAVQNDMPSRIKDILVENLEATQDDVYSLTPPLGLSHLMGLLRLARPDLKDAPYHPAAPLAEDEGEDIFALIRRGDVLLHHPYDSFAPVVQLIKTAARDPNVLAIKQTLYRIGKESPLIPLFIEAAENGKQVAVLVELKARFDEENNITWAKQLERSGIHVVYGLVGLKVHAKMALIVRKEADGLRRYVHLGTGNYNPATARVYTDFSLLTCADDITAEATEVFNYLTGYSQRDTYRTLAVAPLTLRTGIDALIDREVAHAKAGKPAHLVFKMNSLTDVRMIEKLYDASQQGVRIELIVRGICCLRPGVPKRSENIRVVSIVGRYLEHSRVYYAANDGHPELFLSSADLMGRNLDRRVELLFPVRDPALVEQIKAEALDAPLQSGIRGHELRSDGSYAPMGPATGTPPVDVQHLIANLRSRAPRLSRIIPREAP